LIREYNLKIDWTLLFIILLPTFYVAGQDLRAYQTNFFQISAIVLVGLMHVNKWLGLFLLWCTFQFVFMKGMPIQSSALQNVFFGAVIYQFIVIFSNLAELRKYLWAFFGILILNVFWIVLQKNQIDPLFFPRDAHLQTVFSDVSGFFALPAFLGNYAAVVLPIAFTLTNTLIPFALIALFFSKSTFSVMAALGASLFYFWFRKRIVFWLILGVFGSGALFYTLKVDYPSGQFNRRLNVWQLIIRQAFQKQFFGHGIGNFKRFTFLEAIPSHNLIGTDNISEVKKFMINEALATGDKAFAEKVASSDHLLKAKAIFKKKKVNDHFMDVEKWEQAHNEFLQVFFETGLVGIFILFAFIVNLFKRFIRYAWGSQETLVLMACFVAILINSVGHFPFHVARLAGPFIVLIALLDAMLIKAQRKMVSEI